MVNQKVESAPGPLDSTQIRLPWTSTIRLDRASPTTVLGLWWSSRRESSIVVCISNERLVVL